MGYDGRRVLLSRKAVLATSHTSQRISPKAPTYIYAGTRAATVPIRIPYLLRWLYRHQLRSDNHRSIHRRLQPPIGCDIKRPPILLRPPKLHTCWIGNLGAIKMACNDRCFPIRGDLRHCISRSRHYISRPSLSMAKSSNAHSVSTE